MGKLYDLERRIIELEKVDDFLNELKQAYEEFKKIQNSVASEIKINPKAPKELSSEG